MTQITVFIIILVCFFGPLFLVPSAFKWTGGIYSQIANGISKLGGRMNQSSQGWLGNYKQRSKWAQKQALKKQVASSAAQQRFARNLGSRGDAKFRRALDRTPLIGYGRHYDKASAAGRAAAHKADIERAADQYAEATRDQDFQKRMREAEAIASTAVGGTATLNGRQITVDAAMQSHAFGQLVEGKRGAAARRVIRSHTKAGRSSTATILKNEHVGKLLSQAPDVYKGLSGFAEMSAGDIAAMDETGWQNMAARAGYLQSLGAQATQADIDELNAIARQASRASSDPRFDEDMTDAKHAIAQTIISGAAQSIPAKTLIQRGTNNQIIAQQLSRVDIDGNEEFIWQEDAQHPFGGTYIANPAFNAQRDGSVRSP